MDQNLSREGLLAAVASVTAKGASGRLQITGPGTRGAFFFISGKLVDAHMGPFSGFPAVNLAVSTNEASFHFDPTVQPPRTTTILPLHERLLLRERFGIETIGSYGAENLSAQHDGASCQTVIRIEDRPRSEMQPADANNAQDSVQKTAPAVINIRGKRDLREIRRRAAKNCVPGRQRNKPAGDTIAKENNQSVTVAVAGEKATKNSTDAKPLEHQKGEQQTNLNTRRVFEAASHAPVHAQVLRKGSSEVSRLVLFWSLVLFTFLGSAVFSYWLNSYFSKKPAPATQVKVVSDEPVGADSERPLIEGALQGKETTVVMPEYPVSAKTKGITGKVTVSVLVNKQGKVVSARALNGDQLLRAAAVAAARKAKFSPEKLGGKTAGTITFSFNL